jgi:hypothetical protein
MSEPSDPTKKTVPGWVTTMAEEGAAAAPGVVVGALAASPLLGAAGAVLGIAVKTGIAAVRSAAASRAQRRTSKFEEEVAAQLESGDPEALARLQDDERFAEVIFQNYRRAMDALDPAVIPALGQLTFAYRNRLPDGFFKSLGQVLQDLAGGEFKALRQIMSAISTTATRRGGAQTIEVTPWKNTDGRQELHFADPEDRQAALCCIAPHDALRVLDLIERHGLAPGFQDHGADLALTNRLELAVETCERVLAIIGREDLDLAPAVYEGAESAFGSVSLDGRGGPGK